MDIADLIRSFAQVSRSLDKKEVQQALKLTEICKALLRLEASDVLSNNSHSTNLIQYSCDCTPLKVRKHYSITGPHQTSRASVKETAEFFVQQIFLTTAVGAHPWQDRLVFREPLQLNYGKSMPSLVACAQKFLKGTWSVGTTSGITIHHQVHDRGMSKGFREAVAGHLANLVAHDESLDDEAATHETLHMYTDASCCLHDSHNAFRWGFQTVYWDNLDQILSDLYAGISCYRASVGKCVPCLCGWLDQVLSPQPVAALPSEAELSELYTAIGVPSELLDTLCGQMHLIWRPADERLLVADNFLQHANAVELLSNTLLGIRRFPGFCASRWITVGTSCRTLVQGLLTGFGGMFQYMKSNGALSDFDAQGALRMTPEVVQACVVAGLSAYVSESFSSLAMADPRLLLQLDGLEEAVVEEMQFLEKLQPSVWIALASLSRSRPWVLRDRTIMAAMSSGAHLYRRVFFELTALPWGMLRSDDPKVVLADIQSLSELSADPVIQRLQQLSRINFPKEALLSAIRLLQSVSFSSHFTERQHASTATLKRLHDYNAATLCPRSFLHTFRPPGFLKPPLPPPNTHLLALGFCLSFNCGFVHVIQRSPAKLRAPSIFAAQCPPMEK